MTRNQLVGGMAVCAAGALLVAVVGRAGDLNPPAGAVQPTMSNLQDIQTSLDNIGIAVGVPTPAWEYKTVTVTGGGEHTFDLEPTSGVLHRVIFTDSPAQEVLISDTNPVVTGPLMLKLDPTVRHNVLLDVRFENGLFVTGQCTVTFLYRLDPTP